MLLYFFDYKAEFFPFRNNQESRSVLYDRSRSFGLFRKDKTCIIAKFRKTDLVTCSHSRKRKTPLPHFIAE